MPNGQGVMGLARRVAAPTACICTRCGVEVEKTRGVPCRSLRCPNCAIPLMGKQRP